MPGIWLYWPLVVLPRGAWGTTTWAACAGLCMGWMGVPTGESLGVEVADIMIVIEEVRTCVRE